MTRAEVKVETWTRFVAFQSTSAGLFMRDVGRNSGLKKNSPLQGEIWLFDPDPVKGNEIGKKVRPALVVSNNLMNKGPSGLVIVIPITSKDKKIPSHIRITPPQGGVKILSFAMSEQVRSISKERFVQRLGKIQSSKILKEIHSWLTDLLWIDA